MREIKFRAWDVKNKKMYYGDIRKFNSLAPFCNAPELFPIMQYTGLHDKNGKEIYEGDILIDSGGDTYEVQYLLYPWMSAFRFWQVKKDWSYGGNGKDIEVIGNIYENPESMP